MLLPTSLDRFVAETAPSHDPIQAEMAEVADESGFPIIGRVAGAFLYTVASARSAEAVFEFGSGFGYSATWFLKGMAPRGEIVLTETDADEAAMAEDFLSRAGEAERATVEQGDAMAIIDRYDGPFDAVLIDHDKPAYAAAFEEVIDKVATGGVVIADNMLDGPVWYEDLLPYVVDDASEPAGDYATGLLRYLRTARGHPACHTLVLPIGNGLAVTTKVT